jgi:hypothetical protein
MVAIHLARSRVVRLDKDRTGILAMASSNSLVEDLPVSEPLPSFSQSIEFY